MSLWPTFCLFTATEVFWETALQHTISYNPIYPFWLCPLLKTDLECYVVTCFLCLLLPLRSSLFFFFFFCIMIGHRYGKVISDNWIALLKTTCWFCEKFSSLLAVHRNLGFFLLLVTKWHLLRFWTSVVSWKSQVPSCLERKYCKAIFETADSTWFSGSCEHDMYIWVWARCSQEPVELFFFLWLLQLKKKIKFKCCV